MGCNGLVKKIGRYQKEGKVSFERVLLRCLEIAWKGLIIKLIIALNELRVNENDTKTKASIMSIDVVNP